MSTHPEYQYLNLLGEILERGDHRRDRTGVGTKALFGASMRFRLAGFDAPQEIPVFTTKQVFWKTAFKEMLWMLSGGRNIRELLQQNVRIWTDWPLKKYREATGSAISQEEFERRILDDPEFAAQWGDLGPVYGHQWRRWPSENGPIDQLAQVVEAIKRDPTSRRIILEGWNVAELGKMALPPCHKTYQFFVSRDNRLSCSVLMRSVDMFLGAPFNIANAAFLTYLLAWHCGREPGELIWFGNDVHIYQTHFDQVRQQMEREPYPFPLLEIRALRDEIDYYKIEDFEVVGYRHHPAIEGEVAV
jgi:thymidylate synthase